MKKYCGILTAIILSCLLLSMGCNRHRSPISPIRNAAATGSISGTVYTYAACDTNKNTSTSFSAVVSAVSGGSVIATAVTGANGYYQFTGLNPGVYYVSASITGTDMSVGITPSVTVTAGSASAGNDIFVSLLYVPGELLVLFNTGISDAVARPIIAAHNCVVINSSLITATNQYMYVITFPSGATPSSTEPGFQAEPDVQAVQTNDYYCAI